MYTIDRSKFVEDHKMSRELLSLPGATSGVWKHFGFPARNGAFIQPEKKNRKLMYCRICDKEIKYSGNTTNLRVHLQYSHSPLFKELVKETEPKRSTPSASTTQSGQITLQQSFQQSEPYVKTSTQWNRLTNVVCYCLGKDMLPFDTVNDTGFKHMLHEFQPRYRLPDRKTIATNYIPAMYEGLKTKISEQLKAIHHFAITTDAWTSKANDSYTTVTIHYIDDEFVFQSHILETRGFTEAVNIAKELENCLSEWKLSQSSLVGVTTDNGANILAAVNQLGWSSRHFSCFSHTLQVGVHKAMEIPRVTKALARCKRLVGHFNHSSKSTNLLKKKQEALGHVKHSLIQDVSTRWNSSFYMIERVLEQQHPLCATLLELKRGDLMPSDEEFSTLESFKQVMQPITEFTEAIGGENWVTISTIRPILHKLLNKHLLFNSCDSATTKLIKVAVCNDLKTRYTASKLDMLNKAAFLDPRFKALKFLQQSEKDETKQAILDEAIEVGAAQAEDQEGKEPPSKKLCVNHKLLKLLEDDDSSQNEESQEEIPLEDRIKSEVQKYITEEQSSEDPLAWWKKNSGQYPTLSKLIKQYLCVPCTSTPSERVFSKAGLSKAGHIVDSKRSCLLPDTL